MTVVIGSTVNNVNYEDWKSRRKLCLMFVMDFIYGSTGGTENQVIKIINNLDQSRYDLYLLCLHNTPWLAENSRSLKCATRAFSYNVFNHKDPRNLMTFFQIVKEIKKIQPDFVMTFFPTSYIFGVLAARLGGVRHIIGTRRDYGLWLNKGRLPFLKFANRFVERIVTNSEAVKEITAREEGYNTSAIDVIYNGIDSTEFSSALPADGKLKEKLGIPPDRKIVGINAGLRPMKRHQTFLKAAQYVLERRNDVHFLIVGDGPMRNGLESLARQFGLDGHVTFAGWQVDVRPFLALFDIGVNCSAKEGLSNAIMEYMAYGVPCIVSDAGGNPELIENGINGFLFELDNDAELAELTLRLLWDTEKQREFVASAKTVVKNKLALEKMINSYDYLFSRVVDTYN